MLSLRISYAIVLPYVDKRVRRDSSVSFVKNLRVLAIFTLVKDAILLFIHYYFPKFFFNFLSLYIFYSRIAGYLELLLADNCHSVVNYIGWWFCDQWLLSNGKNALLVNCGRSCPKLSAPDWVQTEPCWDQKSKIYGDLKEVTLSKVSKWNQWLDLSEDVALLGTSWSPWLCHGEALGALAWLIAGPQTLVFLPLLALENRN